MTPLDTAAQIITEERDKLNRTETAADDHSVSNGKRIEALNNALFWLNVIERDRW